MAVNYFERDPSLHAYLILAPVSRPHGLGLALVVQGTRRDVAHQVTAHHESFRVLLHKRAVFRSGHRPQDVREPDTYALRRGAHVVLVPDPTAPAEPFTQDVLLVCVTDTHDAALAAASVLDGPALACEVLEIDEAGLGPA